MKKNYPLEVYKFYRPYIQSKTCFLLLLSHSFTVPSFIFPDSSVTEVHYSDKLRRHNTSGGLENTSLLQTHRTVLAHCFYLMTRAASELFQAPQVFARLFQPGQSIQRQFPKWGARASQVWYMGSLVIGEERAGKKKKDLALI